MNCSGHCDHVKLTRLSVLWPRVLRVAWVVIGFAVLAVVVELGGLVALIRAAQIWR